MIPADLIKIPKKNSKYSDHASRGTIPRLRGYLEKCCADGKMPYIEEFAISLGVSKNTILNWCGDYPKFKEECELLLTVQLFELKRKSLNGKFVTKAATLLMSAEHGIVERIKKEVSGADGNPLEVISKLSPEERKSLSEEITKAFERVYRKDE